MTNNINNIITILKVTKKGKKYLVTSSAQEIECTEEQLVEYRIFKDKKYTQEEWEQIRNSQEVSNYFSKCLNYISFKLRTKKEIKDYLKEHDASFEVINKVIHKLIEYRLLDDKIYTTEYINTSIKNKKGPKLIEHNLRLKGIENDLLYLIDELYDKNSQKENIIYIIEKEIPKLITFPIIKQKEKLKSKLLRDGYSEPLISSCIGLFSFTSDITNRIVKEYNLYIKKGYSDLKIKQKLYQKGYSISDINKVMNK